MDEDERGRSDKPKSSPQLGPEEGREAAPSKDMRTAEKQQITHEALGDRSKASDRWMIILTAAIALGGFASALIFKKQLDVMMGQLKEVQLSREADERAKRPFLKLTQPKVTSITVDDVRVTIDLDLRARNVGQTAAGIVLLTVDAIPSDLADNPQARLEQTCSEARIEQGGSAVAEIYSDDVRPIQGGRLSVDLDVIRAAREASVRKSFADHPEGLKEALSFPLASNFLIVGCLTYSYGTGHAIGQTPVWLDINRRCQKGRDDTCLFPLDRRMVY